MDWTLFELSLVTANTKSLFAYKYMLHYMYL